MGNALTELIHQSVTSPWIYVFLFAIVCVDGFFPLVPGETLVIAAGVYAASGRPNLFLVIAVAVLGAWVGDQLSYLFGRAAGADRLRRRRNRLRSGRRNTAMNHAMDNAMDTAATTLTRSGGLILVAARYVPGGRTAVTMAAGAVRYPRRWFALIDAIAVLPWAVYSALIGYAGGVAFAHDPLRGTLFGVGVGIATGLVIEGFRRALRPATSWPRPGGRLLVLRSLRSCALARAIPLPRF